MQGEFTGHRKACTRFAVLRLGLVQVSFTPLLQGYFMALEQSTIVPVLVKQPRGMWVHELHESTRNNDTNKTRYKKSNHTVLTNVLNMSSSE